MRHEERYCAFVDILGFQGIIHRLSNGDISFQELRDVLNIVHAPPREDQIASFGGSDLRAQSISDAVCLSAATTEAGLSHLFFSLEELSINLLQRGYFVRGAVVKGNLYHDERMVFGSALVEAFKLESEVAHFPRIMVMSDVAGDVWKYQ